MKRSPCVSALLPCVCALALGACGGEDPVPEGAATPATELAWEELIDGDWTVDPSTEAYYCVRRTLTEDRYVKSLEAVNPVGTHHTVLSVGDPSGPDGMAPCRSFENNRTTIFGSGVGENRVVLPEGVAIRLPKGQQLLVNLHLFNAGEAPLSGRSGTRVIPADPDEVEVFSDATLMGTLDVKLPPASVGHAEGGCVVDQETTIFGVFPHMHQLGRHQRVTVERPGEPPLVIHDGPYDFENQHSRPVEPPVKLRPGDAVRVECTYENPGQETVTFGESTKEEMCFAGIARFPESGQGICVNLEK